MRISGFVHGITNPELIKRFHEKIPKTVDEMMQVATSFLQGQEAALNQERKKTLPTWKHQEGSHKQNFKKRRKLPHPTEVGHNTDECNHLRKQIEDMLKAGKLTFNQGVKIKQRERPAEKERRAIRKRKTSGNLNDSAVAKGAEGPLIIEAEIGGHQVYCMYVDGGSSFEILYEHCFNKLR
ncbi:hypothetical protein Tco_0327735 [Tanacetum coccineum]